MWCDRYHEVKPILTSVYRRADIQPALFFASTPFKLFNARFTCVLPLFSSMKYMLRFCAGTVCL